MFTTYINHPDIYENKFLGEYYSSGDIAYKDEDGYFWFVGRNDDVINTAGHLISPFEVESALLEIPEIADAGLWVSLTIFCMKKLLHILYFAVT